MAQELENFDLEHQSMQQPCNIWGTDILIDAQTSEQAPRVTEAHKLELVHVERPSATSRS